MTIVELKVALCVLEERLRVLGDTERRFTESAQWNQRRAVREERHQKELRRAEIEKRIRAMEGG